MSEGAAMPLQGEIVSSWRIFVHVKIVWTVDGEGCMGHEPGVIFMIEARPSAILRYMYMALNDTTDHCTKASTPHMKQPRKLGLISDIGPRGRGGGISAIISGQPCTGRAADSYYSSQEHVRRLLHKRLGSNGGRLSHLPRASTVAGVSWPLHP
jgi:hypothetical protein